LAIDLNALIISIIVNIIILSPVLWLSGRAFVGKEKAKFTDAVATIAVGTVVGSVFSVVLFIVIIAALGLLGLSIISLIW